MDTAAGGDGDGGVHVDSTPFCLTPIQAGIDKTVLRRRFSFYLHDLFIESLAMKNNLPALVYACTLFGLSISWQQAMADGVLDLNPYVSGTVTYDDNVFRLAGRQEALAVLGEEKMSDTIRTLNAGINADLELGRQLLRLGLGGTQVRYSHFTFQDYNGSNYNLGWDWRIGSHFYGELSRSHVLSQSGFTEFQSTLLNERTVQRDVLRANWEIHPRWRASVSHEEVSQDNSEPQFRLSDRDESSNEAGLTYQTPKGSELGLSVRRLETDYPGRPPLDVLLYGKSNRQDEIILRGKCQPSDKLFLNGRISTFTREGDGPAAKEFEGRNIRLEVNWQATEKSSLVASAWREFRLADDLSIGFARVSGMRLTPAWRPTSKVLIQADAMKEEVSYLEGGRAGETLNTYGLNMIYLPHEKVRAQVGWQHVERETPQVLSSYRSNSFNASVSIDF